ncbi:MAG: ATP-binding protein [Bacteroidales bacterium]|jgi:hypothetical protein|nr:ATP-binding protein [Bacteroidales bacterium]
MNKALSIYQVLSSRHDTLNFDGEWLEAIGNPAACGSWIIWGQSFNGKTAFAMQLAKYLCRFGKVLYNSMEEGVGRSIQVAIERTGMDSVARRFNLLDSEDIDELMLRLSQRKHPKVVIMDSIQYSGINYAQYKEIKKKFNDILWIWISQAEGRLPEGRLANRVRYDAMVKIRVEGYRAYINSRFKADYQGKNYITVWEEGARRYWGENEE